MSLTPPPSALSPANLQPGAAAGGAAAAALGAPRRPGSREGGGVGASAVAGTVVIAVGAFWLSFEALRDLAARSGIAGGQAWAWPLILDGLIVVATTAVVALNPRAQRWYPWLLLLTSAAISVGANATHALLAPDRQVPDWVAAGVASVPPVVLLAITHLTVILTRSPNTETRSASSGPLCLKTPTDPRNSKVDLPDSVGDRRVVAGRLRAAGWTNRAIAERVGVHPSTVGRWLAASGRHNASDVHQVGRRVSVSAAGKRRR